MRVLFFGTGEIAIPSFTWLAESPDHELVGLVTQPDTPSGRKLASRPPKIKTLAASFGDFPVFQPQRVRTQTSELRALSADAFVVMAYGQILPREILEIPKVACINLHASLLPKHRGASPIQAAILSGDQNSGITVMHMAESLDTGDIILAEAIQIHPDETGGSLHDRLAAIAPIALEKALTLLGAGSAFRSPQTESDATYAPKLDRLAGSINWSLPAESIARTVRAFDPWPGTFCRLPGGRALKFYPPVDTLPAGACPVPGTVLSAGTTGLCIATGDGIVRFHTVQVENRRRLPVAEFLNGNPLSAGDVLG